MSKAIQVPQAPQFPLPFSHAVQAGDFIYVSGQVGVDPITQAIAGPTIEEQTRQCLRNVEIILASVGLTLDHVIKSNAFVSRTEDFTDYNKTYSEVFQQPYPARTTAPVDLGAYLVEIDVIAYAPSKRV
ncbi:2-aminomuconate deaminase [Paenibacillus allorhizoplanae]|uniref:2-aminomuconate deaminase n=1 Tax=Paenibacillus allorhizoplanae TaxID=2905648 RepID=A0ABM9CFI2_9BACL|nr:MULTISPECIES: RidA family protein [Paenibacillus]KRE61817.1 YjgF-like translation initiation inhibitor [Paenibacillus sp. Soil750]CAH1211022.1 2-aminomuconate deaminase [Paenibacillus allorhizoplanae]